jgi:hypothetical protein
MPVMPCVNQDRTVVTIPVMMRRQPGRERSDERYEHECLKSENRSGTHLRDYAPGGE